MAALTLGTRGSALARWQTDWVVASLQAAWPGLACSVRLYATAGDRSLDKPLPEIGGKGLFTAELEDALRAGEIDLAVHSLKDLPIDDGPGLTLGAICERAEARDALISRDSQTLATLPPGAQVGTSSLRRAAQVLAARPDVTILPLRGNVDSRVRKALTGEYDAIVLAAAGLQRLDLAAHISQVLPLAVMLPAPGQGALAVQCRADDASTLGLFAPLDHPATRAAVTAERAFLKALGGGCAAPVAAYAEFPAAGEGSLAGLVASTDGCRVVRVSSAGHDPAAVGAQAAQQALRAGAGELLP